MPTSDWQPAGCKLIPNTLLLILVALLPTSSILAQESDEVLIEPSSVQLSINGESITNAITEATLRGHIRFLADDLLEGRGPGSRGDQLTQLYLQTQFQSLGLSPAGSSEAIGALLDKQADPQLKKLPADNLDLHASWTQPVPLIGVQTTQPQSVTFSHGDASISFESVKDFMSNLGNATESTEINDAEVVFVGYGIDAPEYEWDDYKDVDVQGKILLMMNNDPEKDPALFEGKKRLYYGRWDYKYKIAAERGAAGAIIIHTTPSAGYPWQVIQTSWIGEEFKLRSDKTPACQFTGWITEEGAKKLVAMTGKELDQLRQEAESRDFRPTALKTRLSMKLAGRVREQDTANVLALLPGSDPELKDEVVVFMAHHDHLGISAERNIDGDNIYNGAVDNASGTAGLLTIAQAFAELDIKPRRSILFAAVGAEEQGLLGSEQFAQTPPLHPGKIAAVVNIDGANILGKTYDVNLIGNGKSSLDTIVEKVASSQQRVVTPDLFPDRGYYYRSDQFSLAKIGVPGVYLHSGINVVGKPDGWGKEQLERWVEETYHQPSDEYQASWNLSGAIQDLQLLALVGLEISQNDDLPKWNAGDEFEAARLKAIGELTQTP